MQISSLFYCRRDWVFFSNLPLQLLYVCEIVGLKASEKREVKFLLRHQLAAMYIKRVIKNLSLLVCTSMMRTTFFPHSKPLVNSDVALFFVFSRWVSEDKQQHHRTLCDDEISIFLFPPFLTAKRCDVQLYLSSTERMNHACDKKHFKRHFTHFFLLFT